MPIARGTRSKRCQSSALSNSTRARERSLEERQRRLHAYAVSNLIADYTGAVAESYRLLRVTVVETMKSDRIGNLTPKQTELLEFVRGYIQHQGRPPSYEEMMRWRGLRTKSAVHKMIEKIEEAGFLRRGPHRAFRSIELV